jgi:rhodanese-related sulfurtransferase
MTAPNASAPATPAAVAPDALAKSMAGPRPPVVVDVRRALSYAEARDALPGALRGDPAAVADWGREMEIGRPVVVYCVHGHEVGRDTAAALSALGIDARFLEGGIEGWRAAGLKLAAKPAAPTLWVTRERPKIDRIACPWLIRRFVDPGARFLYVPPGDVERVARERGGEPYDIPGVRFSHVGEKCSFDALIGHYRLAAPGLDRLAEIVRGADTSRLDLTPQSAGLFAISLGLGAIFDDDYAMLRHGMVMYDALYAWCRRLQGETHAWPPAMPAAADGARPA